MRTGTRLALAVALLGLPRFATAGGYYVPDLGTVARSRGGAFAAAADDPTAMAYNPAGLADQRESALLFDISALWLHDKFQRDPSTVAADSPAGTSATSTNNPPPNVTPDIIYVHPVGSKMTIAGGLHAPAGPRYHYDIKGLQRYTVGDLTLQEASYGVAVAYRFSPVFAAGISLEGMLQSVDQTLAVTKRGATEDCGTGPGNCPPTEALANDSNVELKVMAPFTPSMIAGVKATPIEHLELGFSFRPGVDISAPGTFGNATISDDVHFKYKIPAILRFGARWVQPAWDVEADFVSENWGTHKDEVIVPDDGELGLANAAGHTFASAPIAREFSDATSIRVGGSWKAKEGLKLHGGLYWEGISVPDKTLDAGTMDGTKTGIGFGASWDANKRFTVSGNLMHTLLASRTVTSSVHRMQAADPDDTASELSVIGNGKYSGAYDFIGFSLLTKF